MSADRPAGEKASLRWRPDFLRRLSNHPRCTAGDWTFVGIAMQKMAGDKFSLLAARPGCTTLNNLAGLWLFFFRGYLRQRQGSRMMGI